MVMIKVVRRNFITPAYNKIVCLAVQDSTHKQNSMVSRAIKLGGGF